MIIVKRVFILNFGNKHFRDNLLFSFIYFFIFISFSYSQYSVSFLKNTDEYTQLKISKTESKEQKKNNDAEIVNAVIAIPQGAKYTIEAENNNFVGEVSFDAQLRDIRVISIKFNNRVLNTLFSNNEVKEIPVFIKYQFPTNIKRNLDTALLLRNKADAFEKIYKDTIINYPFPDSYRIAAANLTKIPTPPFSLRYKNAVKIITISNGFYEIKVNDLKEQFASINVPIDINNVIFQLWNKGCPQILYKNGENKDDPSIFFKADSIDTKYANQNVYWITVSNEKSPENAAYQRLPKGIREDDISRPSVMHGRQIKPLTDTKNKADYIIITHRNFIGSANKLAQWRQKYNGFKAVVIDIDDIYDEFNFGIVSPEAVKKFLEYIYFYWEKPAAAYITLFGDASENFKNDDPKFVKNFVPTYYPEDQNGNPDDAGFASFLGSGELPAMIVGRLPVYDEKTANAVVDKIIQFEQKPEFGLWRGIISYLGDNDYEDLFDDDVAYSVPKNFLLDRIYVRDYPYVDHYAIPEVKISQEANDVVVEHLNRGNLGVHYVGHGGVTLLSHEKMLFYTDVENLNNQGRLPFMVQISCHTAYFDFSEAQWRSSISELLLEKENGGAIGIFAAARRLGGSEKFLQELLFNAMYANAPTTFGVMTTEVKINYIIHKGRGHFINNYHLLGDPVSPFTLPAADMEVVVDDGILYTHIYNNKPQKIAVRGHLKEAMDGNLIVGIFDEKAKNIVSSPTLKITSKSFRRTFELPKGLSVGEYYAFCYFWNSDKKYDAIGKATFKIEAAPFKAKIKPDTLPDLTLKGGTIDFKNPNVRDGDSLFVDAKVFNQGTNAAENAEISCYVMKNKEKLFKLIKTTSLDKVLPGEVKDTIFRWDDFYTAGDTTFKISIDENNKIKETNKKNNTFTKVLRIKTKPNLMIDPADVQIKEENNKLNVKMAITNNGEWDAIPSVTQVFIGTEKGISTEVGGDIPTPAIRSKCKSPAIDFILSLPTESAAAAAAPSQLNYLYFRLDAKSKIGETNEDDNVLKYRYRW